MPWKTTSQESVFLLESALSHLPCEKKRMFGCPVYFAGGSLFAGVHGESIFLRLSEPDRQEFLLAHPGAVPFEPLPGRRMREYLVAPPAMAEDRDALQRWLSCAYGYAESLPVAPRRSARGRVR